MVIAKRNNNDHLFETGNKQWSPVVKVLCFVEPPTTLTLPPSWTISLFMLHHLTSPLAPIIITTGTRGRLTENLTMGRYKLLAHTS